MNIFVDVDKALYQAVGKPNEMLLQMLRYLKASGAKVYAWSDGGRAYAVRVVTLDLHLPMEFFDGYYLKGNSAVPVDITIENEEIVLGTLNLRI